VLRRAALLALLACALVLAPLAPGLPNVPGDQTPPVVTPSITGTLGDDGWYRTNVTVSWVISDPESVILRTSGCDTVTLSTDTVGTRLSCTAESDGGETTVAKTFKVDKTAPGASAAPSRSADENGWYNHPLSVSFDATDGTSGVQSCSPTADYAGPDTSGTPVAGTCRDVAGNTSPASFSVKYDATAPSATPSARQPDANGWFNHAVTVTFQGADGTSGVDTCTQTTYSGPDDSSVAIPGTCTDHAGNVSASGSFTLKYDETAPSATAAPSRGADVNGWHNHPLTVTFSGSDATSGLDSCDAPKSYSSPDDPTAEVSGSCRDRAGNVSPRTFAFKYDATAPGVTATPGRAANGNGWYRAPIDVTFAGTDPVSGVGSCSAPKTYSGPDSGAAEVSGNCTDVAGNVGVKAFGLKYDATVPGVTATPGRSANGNGWYNAPIGVTFAGTDGTSGIDTCDAPKTYSGPDSPGTSVSGSCRDKAGNSGSASQPLKYDATLPDVTAAPGRPPGTGGWYNAPLSVSFSGEDGTSGVDTCDAAKTYSGPDNGSAAVAGACRDKAGNSATDSFALKYDATAPQVNASPSRSADSAGWYNHALSVSFQGSDATAGVDSCDAAKSYSGPDSSGAPVSGTCRDKAGNAGNGSFTVKYDATAPGVTGATPSRPADVAGWHNHALSVQFQGADAMSGLESCTRVDYSGPDSATATVNGSCVDRAANRSATSPFGFKYDATAPGVTAAPDRPVDANGWFNHPLSVRFTGVDPVSDIQDCDAPKSFSGPDTPSTSVSGSCRDRAGNSGSGAVTLKYDSTKPTANATPSRPANANGWYAAPLTVSFSGNDVLSGLDSCDPDKSYSGPDSSSAPVSGACRDKAGNAGSATLSVKYDATAPGVTGGTPSRPADHGTWHNHPLSVQFQGADAMSGLDSCSRVDYAGPDSSTASVSGSCSDRAGNRSASSAFGFKYDATSPAVTAAPDRPMDANGWFNHPLSVTFTGSDATSGVEGCDAPKGYSGPDTASTAVSGACRDNAGNSGSGSATVKYDATKPSASAAPSRAPNGNGWYASPLTVSFSGNDALSGLASCDAPKGYSGPDSAVGSVSGACRDNAGNSRTASLTVKYDATAPTASAAAARAPDANGWYNHPLTVDFDGADATSGIDSCSADAPYGGPDTQSVALSGSCRDRAGNDSATAALTVKYDATAPQVLDADAVRPPDRAGWYNRPVAFAVEAQDATSGIASCPAISYAGPDSGSASMDASCADRAGNRGSRPFPLRYDATGPATTAVTERAPDRNGWYNHPVAVSFAGADSVSGLESCSPPERYEGPDSAQVVVGGVCIDRAGNAGLASIAAGYDATAPALSAAQPDRLPDANGWYRRPVSVSFRGADGMSQIEDCTRASYAGPDAAAAVVAGSCVDRAGNRSATSFQLRYDATAPTLGNVHVKAGNGSATISWTASSDTALVEVRRGDAVVYAGGGQSFTDRGLKNGVLYRYAVSALDEATNAATSSVAGRPSGPLASPLPGAVVSSPPRLAWAPVPRATYYNVQLWRKGRILSLWPRGTSLKLPRTWTYKGKRYKLTRGSYRWYVWPGYGRRSQERFGKLLGSSSFSVR
jgi:hypothetical protein